MKDLADLFGIEPKVVKEVKEVPVIYDPKGLPVPIKKPIDFNLDVAIDALKFNIEEGQKLYLMAKDVARESDSSKLFEVSTEIIGEIRENALALMDLHKKYNEAEKITESPGEGNVKNQTQVNANNVNVIKASSSDLLKIFTEMKSAADKK
jgi:hypothetical protein